MIDARLAHQLAKCYEDLARQYLPFLANMPKDRDEQFSADEAARRRDAALRNALNTPRKPHEAVSAKPKTRRKRAASAKPKTAA